MVFRPLALDILVVHVHLATFGCSALRGSHLAQVPRASFVPRFAGGDRTAEGTCFNRVACACALGAGGSTHCFAASVPHRLAMICLCMTIMYPNEEYIVH